MAEPHPHAPDGELSKLTDTLDWPAAYEADPGPPEPELHYDGYGLPFRPPAAVVAKQSLTCPQCKQPSTITITRYGRRDDCKSCGLWSWKGKPLVDKATHAKAKAEFAAK